MIGELDQLIIGEDTEGHVNDLVWIYDLKSGAMTRIASTPYGSETTSPYWHTLGDYNYMTFVVQHPYGETKDDEPATIAAMKTLSEKAPAMVSTCMSVVRRGGEDHLHMYTESYRWMHILSTSNTSMTYLVLTRMYTHWCINTPQPKTNSDSAPPPGTAGYVGYIGPFTRVNKAVVSTSTDKAAAAPRSVSSSIFYGVKNISLCTDSLRHLHAAYHIM